MRLQNQKLYDHLVSVIDVGEFYKSVIKNQEVEFDGRGQALVWCPFHNPTAAGNSPSLSISADGKFFCHSGGCGAFGSNVIQFYEKFHRLSLLNTLSALHQIHLGPVISPQLIEQYHVNLIHTPELLTLLRKQRGIEKATVEQYKLGFDNDRITIPVENQYGLYTNIRRYDYKRTSPCKMLNYKAGYGGVMIYPYQNLGSSRILLCEGEWDALLASQLGFNAVTTTGGVGSWKAEFTDLFKGKEVTICFDVNDKTDAGQLCAQKRANDLLKVAQSVRIVALPIPDAGGDITDYFLKHQKTPEDFKLLCHNSAVLHKQVVVEEGEKDDDAVYEVSLSEASKAQYYNKNIKMNCIVSGKDISPYLIPKEVRTICKAEKKCPGCEHEEKDVMEWTINYDKCPENVLAMIRRPTNQINQYLKKICGLTKIKDCTAVVEIMKTANVQQLQLIPEIDYTDKNSPYVLREGFLVDHDIETNKTYQMEARTIPDPSTQHAVHVIYKATPAQTSIDAFKMVTTLDKALKKVFRPASDSVHDIEAKLEEMCQHLAQNQTRIFQRPDLHLAILLPYHSVEAFHFNNELIWGLMDVAIIGDSRTGKGKVAEGLQRFLGLGEVVSAENCSYAGLIGGIQQFNNRFIVTWGKMVLNDRRLVIVDEMTALAYEDIGRMSRCRSERIAEISKIHTERTHCRTRLIWLGNSRFMDFINEYANSVEVIKEVFGKTEDVARLDFAFTTSMNEVSLDVMNSPAPPFIEHSPYTQQLCRDLTTWSWSRKADQILFTPKATALALDGAKQLSMKYSSSIPLVQGETMRHKLARGAVAVACLTYSSVCGGSKVLVTPGCVQAYANFLTKIYDKMGYDDYSRGAADRSTLKDPGQLDIMIYNMTEKATEFTQGLLYLDKITEQDIMDLSAEPNRERARTVISTLVRNKAVHRKSNYYIKRPAFIQYLKAKLKDLQATGNPKFKKEAKW